jgi:hypothetical protein
LGEGIRFTVGGEGFGVWGLGFRVEGSGFRDPRLGFSIEGVEPRVHVNCIRFS